MSMTIREVIHKLMEAKDLDKECVIEVSKSVFDNAYDDYTWVDVDIEKISNCDWGCIIEGEEYETE